ncbi:apolipoprotein N-acyltransferase, partial [Deltaproteobacteria bacterium OttesenSCG-928-K17]|nr:apolipoprotein N-acyltransferase [Deltaproteobacteria bacterium OttesenSCG-928-K17]
PETAMPFLYDYDFVESQWLRQMSKDAGSPILAGIAGLGGFWPEQKMHNRMILLNKGELVAYYDKMHLVPFGEYLPLDWLPFLKWAFMQGLIGEAGTYDPGSPMPLIETPLFPDEPDSRKVRLGLLICFESTFPYLGQERALQGADLLIVPTNDGWFGRSRAPRQHLYQAVMRAVETRRPLVRAGNTGISGLIYPTGEIAWQSGLYDIGAYPLTTPILKPQDLRPTIFVRGGYLMAPVMAVLTGILALIRLFRRG